MLAKLKDGTLYIINFVDIEPAEKGPSGRIVKVRVIAGNGSKVLRTRTTLRRALNLPEILLEIKRTNGQFIFDGRGWGHGVGYSQWGSAILGKERSYPMPAISTPVGSFPTQLVFQEFRDREPLLGPPYHPLKSEFRRPSSLRMRLLRGGIPSPGSGSRNRVGWITRYSAGSKGTRNAAGKGPRFELCI
ncbi:MAG: hypothetical protein ACLFUL_17665 [Desulfobacteraceae bacterium]